MWVNLCVGDTPTQQNVLTSNGRNKTKSTLPDFAFHIYHIKCHTRGVHKNELGNGSSKLSKIRSKTVNFDLKLPKITKNLNQNS